jgi:NAD(P) transhydrogenase subunit alpha
MTVTITVLREQAAGERRVALDPPSVKKLQDQTFDVQLQSDSGTSAGFGNDDYEGVTLFTDTDAALADSDLTVWVQPPTAEQVQQLKPGSIACGMVMAHKNTELLEVLKQRKISTLAMELVPRITRAQAMDVLSSQATVSGYEATLRAAELSPRLFPMLTTAAGTLRPSSVVVIGAGVAGLQAIATARRLGGRVQAYDIRPDAREQVESLGARMIDTGVSAEGEGGYARELTDEEKQQQADALAQHLTKTDVIICTAAIPGRPAPKIITEAMVEGMARGTAIVDLAAESGGNCVLTRPGETVNHNGVIIDGPLNLASRAALHASEMYARNIMNLIGLMIEDGDIKLNREDEVIEGCLLTHDGELVHEMAAKQINAAKGN